MNEMIKKNECMAIGATSTAGAYKSNECLFRRTQCFKA